MKLIEKEVLFSLIHNLRGCTMDKHNWCVYIHTNKINNKVYIGITCKSPNDRWRSGANYKHNVYFNNAIMKYGWQNFEHIIFADCLSKSDAHRIERSLIALWRSNKRQYGYNLSAGGESSHSGCKHSLETREHLRRINLGDNNPMRRKERKEVIPNKPKTKPVYCVELDKVFQTIQEAADLFKIEASNISKCCKGMRYTAGKMHWQYAKRED